MKTLKSVPTGILAICTGLMSVIACIMVAWLLGVGENTLYMLANCGTGLVLLATIAYITFWHSKKRWPDLPWYYRMGRALTFYND